MLFLLLLATSLFYLLTSATSLSIYNAAYSPVSEPGHDQMYRLDLDLNINGFAQFFIGSTINIELDYIHHISTPFSDNTISIYLKNNDSLIFQSVGEIESSSSDCENYAEGTSITFAASRDFIVPENEELSLYLTLYVGFINGNDYYMYENPNSINSVTPGNNGLGIYATATLATDVLSAGPVFTATSTVPISLASVTTTDSSLYRYDAEIAWINNEDVLGISADVPVVEIFATVYPQCQNGYSFVTANYRVVYDSAFSLPDGVQYSFAASTTDMNPWNSAGININPSSASNIQGVQQDGGNLQTQVALSIEKTSETGIYYIYGGAAIATAGLQDGLYTFSHYGSMICASGDSTTVKTWADGQALSIYNAINSGYATETFDTVSTTTTWSESTSSSVIISPPDTEIYNSKLVLVTIYVPTTSSTDNSVFTTAATSTSSAFQSETSATETQTVTAVTESSLTYVFTEVASTTLTSTETAIVSTTLTLTNTVVDSFTATSTYTSSVLVTLTTFETAVKALTVTSTETALEAHTVTTTETSVKPLTVTSTETALEALTDTSTETTVKKITSVSTYTVISSSTETILKLITSTIIYTDLISSNITSTIATIVEVTKTLTDTSVISTTATSTHTAFIATTISSVSTNLVSTTTTSINKIFLGTILTSTETEFISTNSTITETDIVKTTSTLTKNAVVLTTVTTCVPTLVEFTSNYYNSTIVTKTLTSTSTIIPKTLTITNTQTVVSSITSNFFTTIALAYTVEEFTTIPNTINITKDDVVVETSTSVQNFTSIVHNELASTLLIDSTLSSILTRGTIILDYSAIEQIFTTDSVTTTTYFDLYALTATQYANSNIVNQYSSSVFFMTSPKLASDTRLIDITTADFYSDKSLDFATFTNNKNYSSWSNSGSKTKETVSISHSDSSIALKTSSVSKATETKLEGTPNTPGTSSQYSSFTQAKTIVTTSAWKIQTGSSALTLSTLQNLFLSSSNNAAVSGVILSVNTLLINIVMILFI